MPLQHRQHFTSDPSDLIDYATSPLFRAWHADRGETKPLPDGYPMTQIARFEPLPIITYNETEYLRDKGELERLLLLASQQEEPKAEQEQKVIPFKPRAVAPPIPKPTPPPPSKPEYPRPAAKLEGFWQHL